MLPPVVDAEWTTEHRAEVVLADVRWYLDGRSGPEAYSRGHLPGALYIDLERRLAGEGARGVGRHPLPSPATFAFGMSTLGISDESTVVAYDDQGGGIAARLVWMLRATGHAAALLDGGLMAWDGPLEMGPPVVAPAAGTPPGLRRGKFTARAWPKERLAQVEDATAAANVVLDARELERYRGEVEPVDPRAGHIPGAWNLPWKGNLDRAGRFLAVEVLRRRFEAVGISEGTSVVSYCGSGITACHNLLARELYGLGRGQLYPGSWSEYAAMYERPLETGDPHRAPVRADEPARRP